MSYFCKIFQLFGYCGNGSILAYLVETPLDLTVQHLGIEANAWLSDSYLYRDILVSSPLARKRCFFQAIIAACMIIPNSLFAETGGFDEGFINGYGKCELIREFTQ